MAIVDGTRILALDFANIVGNYSSNTAFPDDLTATNSLNALFGVGYGSRGWGQIPFTYTGTGNGTQTEFDIGVTTSMLSVSASVNNIAVKVASVIGTRVTLESAPGSGTVVKIYVHLLSPQVGDLIYASSWRFMNNAVTTLNSFLNIPPTPNIPQPLPYKINTSATSGDPGDGYILYNNTQGLATEIHISKKDAQGNDVSLLLNQILVGRFNLSAPSKYQTVVPIPTSNLGNNATYYILPVAEISGSNFADNEDVEMLVFETGDAIKAWAYNWGSAVRLIDKYRKNIPTSSLNDPVVKISNSRTTPWPDLVQLKCQVDFVDEDHARWFFNAGGAITITPSFVPTDPLDTHSSSWRTMLSGSNPTSAKFAGSFTIKADSATRSLDLGGNFQSVGYYTLRQQTTQILNFRVADLDNSLINPTGIYKDYVNNYYTASASVQNVIGANGGNGRTIAVELIFNDVWGTSYQPVNGELSVQITMTKANTLSIQDPTFTVTTGLSVGGGDVYYPYITEIATDTNNYNLLTAAMSAGYNNTSGIPLRATVTIPSNVIIGSTDLTHALTVPSLVTGSQVTIRNNGYIVGKGGDGGSGTAHTAGVAGTAGGPALLLQHTCTLTNNGIIGGGGGGGGGASAANDLQTEDDPGGSGGGGAGTTVGSGGPKYQSYTSYAGANGTLLQGGVGGRPSEHGGSQQWWQAGNGGKGGDLGQAGSSGQNGNDDNGYGGGLGGTAGVAITGTSYLADNSSLGDIRGSQIA